MRLEGSKEFAVKQICDGMTQATAGAKRKTKPLEDAKAEKPLLIGVRERQRSQTGSPHHGFHRRTSKQAAKSTKHSLAEIRGGGGTGQI